MRKQVRGIALVVIGMAALSLAACAESAAGPGSGGGGNAVSCPGGVELLDYYEARQLNGIQVDLGAPDLAVERKVELALARLDKFDDLFASDLRESVKAFFAYTGWTSGAELAPIDDSHHAILPATCEVKRLATQKARRFPDENIYYVNKDLWDRMNNDNRAGLVLHEVLYRLARQKGAQDSSGVRYFTALLSSRRFEALSARSYVGTVQGAGLNVFGIGRVRLVGGYVAPKDYHPSGAIKEGCFVRADRPLLIGGQPVKPRVSSPECRPEFGLREDGSFEFVLLGDNGGISLPLRFVWMGRAQIGQVSLQDTRVWLAADGRVLGGMLTAPFRGKGYSVRAVKVSPETGEGVEAGFSPGSIVPTSDAKAPRLRFDRSYCRGYEKFKLTTDYFWPVTKRGEIDLAGDLPQPEEVGWVVSGKAQPCD